MKQNPILTSILAAFLLTLGLAAHAGTGAEEKTPMTIGVYKIAGPNRTLANNIADLLTASLSTNEHLSLVDRTQLDKVLGEMQMGLAGTVDADTAAKVGHLTGAKVLVTGREMLPTGQPMVIIVNMIGTQNGRIFSQTAQGPRTNLVAVVAELSQRVAETILKQSTNLVTGATKNDGDPLERIMQQTKGKKLPTVSIRIKEETGGGVTASAENELQRIFLKAGFAIVDEKAEQRPDVIITGDAVTSKPEKRGNLFSCAATLSIKAEDRLTGKVLALDLQRGTAAGVGDQTTRQQALQQAAEELSVRLVPSLVR